MENRKLTVYSGTTAAYNMIPKIILQGNWLGELGFSIGDKVTVGGSPICLYYTVWAFSCFVVNQYGIFGL